MKSHHTEVFEYAERLIARHQGKVANVRQARALYSLGELTKRFGEAMNRGEEAETLAIYCRGVERAIGGFQSAQQTEELFGK